MIRGLQTIALWTAGLCALAGTGFTAAFLFSQNPQPYVLTAAAIAAAIGLVSLLIGVAIGHVLAGRRLEWGMRLAQPGLFGNESAQDEAARFEKRLQLLDQRLKIDEPRLCSQFMIPCTCWSFCAGSPDRNSAAGATLPATQELRQAQHRAAEQDGLPMVCRTGRDDCPFRFASPLRQRD